MGRASERALKSGPGSGPEGPALGSGQGWGPGRGPGWGRSQKGWGRTWEPGVGSKGEEEEVRGRLREKRGRWLRVEEVGV